MSVESAPRLDKWLWAVRLFKTRSLATEACRAGQVKKDGRNLKPGYTPKRDDRMMVRCHGLSREIRVLELIDKRVGAPLAVACYEDLTDPSERARQQEQLRDAPYTHVRGGGRPSKKDRRDIRRFFG